MSSDTHSIGTLLFSGSVSTYISSFIVLFKVPPTEFFKLLQVNDYNIYYFHINLQIF